MNEKNITLSHLSIVLERISLYVSKNYAPSFHNHSSEQITIMHGYSIASESYTDMHVSVFSSDTLNIAIGKLERSIFNIAYKIETDLLNHVHDDIYYRKEYIDKKEEELLESDQQILSTANAYTNDTVRKAVTDLVNAAPETLDTLGELANALGNDENFATTIATELSKKVDGPNSATIDHIAIFNNSNGKSVKDSGFTIQTSVPPGALFTDHNVKTSQMMGRTLYLAGTPSMSGETNALGIHNEVYITSSGYLRASVFVGDLQGKADTAGIADEALKTRGNLIVQVESSQVDTFNGSSNKTVNITRDLLDVHDKAYTEKATDAEIQSLLNNIFEV